VSNPAQPSGPSPDDEPVDEAGRPERYVRAPLRVVASLVAVEALGYTCYGVLELASTTSTRMAVGLTSGGFLVVWGLLLAACAWAVSRRQSWSRAPIILAQLIQLGLAWSFWGDQTIVISLVLGLVAVVVVSGLLHPHSIEALAEE
jgi:hypothetical protein